MLPVWVGCIILLFGAGCGRLKEKDASQLDEIHSMLAESDTIICSYSEDTNLKKDSVVYNLMNRMVQMFVAKDGHEVDYTLYLWEWMKACTAEMEKACHIKYGRNHCLNPEFMLGEVEDLIAPYGASSQYEMTTCSFVNAVLDSYRTVRLYWENMETTVSPDLKKMIYDEFKEWLKLESAFYAMYEECVVGMGNYSSASMELNGVSEMLSECRMDGLKQDKKIYREELDGRKADSRFDWVEEKDFLFQIRRYESGQDSTARRHSTDSYSESVMPALRDWLSQREKMTEFMPDSNAAAFRFESKRMEYMLLRMLMNRMAFIDGTDRKIYHIQLTDSSERLDDEELYSYVYDGKFRYLGWETWEVVDEWTLCDLYDFRKTYPQARIICVCNGRVSEVDD